MCRCVHKLALTFRPMLLLPGYADLCRDIRIPWHSQQHLVGGGAASTTGKLSASQSSVCFCARSDLCWQSQQITSSVQTVHCRRRQLAQQLVTSQVHLPGTRGLDALTIVRCYCHHSGAAAIVQVLPVPVLHKTSSCSKFKLQLVQNSGICRQAEQSQRRWCLQLPGEHTSTSRPGIHLVHVINVVVVVWSHMSSTVCEYEQARLQRMRDNQLRLKELGIKQAVCAMDVSKSSVKVAARYCILAKNFERHCNIELCLFGRPKRKREAQTAGVARRSAR